MLRPGGRILALVVAATALGWAGCSWVAGLYGYRAFPPGDGGAEARPDGAVGADARLDSPVGEGGAEAGRDGAPCDAGSASDPKNCGACGHDCLGGSCLSGQCQPFPVATVIPHPFYMTQDKDSLYVTDFEDAGAVYRIDKGSALAPIVIAGNEPQPWDVAVDDAWVYWTLFDVSLNLVPALRRAPKDGGPSVLLSSSSQLALEVAVDATYAYWTEYDSFSIHRVPKGGGVDETLAVFSAGTEGLALDQGAFYVAVDGNGGPQDLESEPIDGGISVVVAGNVWPRRIAIDDQNVYGVSPTNQNVYAAPKDGGTVSVLATFQGINVGGIAVDGTDVYWVADMDGRVMRASKDGGTPARVASGTRPVDVVVDAVRVCWTDDRGGLVMCAAK